MPEKIKQTWGRVRAFFKNMKKAMKIGLIVGGVVIIGLVTALVIFGRSQPYEVLFGGLSSEDMTTVATYLNNVGVTDFKIRNNDTILVKESQVDRLRALVVQQGYPTTGYSYETYLNNIGPLSSQADREELSKMDLQEHLAKTIRCFDGVTDATVIISPGEDHRYILEENVTKATAGVFVQMKQGKTLTKDQVAAIQRWVASAVKGLEIDSVTVEDGAGNRYTTDPTVSETLDDTMKRKLSLEAKVNEDRRNSIMNVLVPICGIDNVEVSVRSTIDVTHSYSELVQYFEPDWAADGSSGGKGIIGTQVWDNSWVRDSDETAGGVVGTTTNTEINEYVTRENEPTGDEREWYTSGEVTYLVTHETTQTEHPSGTITDISVAIAVNSAKVPLQDLGKLVHLAATAANIPADVEADKVAIVSYPFYQSGGTGTGESAIEEISMLFGLPAWAVYAAIAGMALFLALLLIMLLLRNKKKKRIAMLLAEEEAAAAAAAAAAEEEAAAAAAAAAAAQQGADIMDVHTEEIMQVRKDVRKFVEENPAIAAQMLKNWLRGEEQPGSN